MHARIVPLALDYEARLYKALSAEERRSFDALTDRLFTHAQAAQAGGLSLPCGAESPCYNAPRS